MPLTSSSSSTAENPPFSWRQARMALPFFSPMPGRRLWFLRRLAGLGGRILRHLDFLRLHRMEPEEGPRRKTGGQKKDCSLQP